MGMSPTLIHNGPGMCFLLAEPASTGIVAQQVSSNSITREEGRESSTTLEERVRALTGGAMPERHDYNHDTYHNLHVLSGQY